MRRFRLLSGVLVCILLAMVYAPASVVASPSMPTAGPPAAHSAPELTAGAAVSIDLTSGLQLYNKNGDTRVAPASTMKMVTVLVASRILGPSELITIVEADLFLGEDYSQMGLMAGDIATVESLLYGAMLSSGADAALALARVAGQRLDPGASDPVARFVEEMNAFAVEHGMMNSSFANPVGVDEEGHYTSARDLVRAAEQMLDDWLLSRVLAMPEIVVAVGGPNAREIYMFSTNQFLLSGDAVGGKTGTTEEAGQCLVNIVRRGDHTIVTVVMGSEDRYLDTESLLEDIGARFRFVVLGAGSAVPGLAEDLVIAGLHVPVSRTVMMTTEQAEGLTYELQLMPNLSTSGKAGIVVFRLGNDELSRLPVYAIN
jgi:serine-type D-Ala-D-Ala carboxypeptidase (penicillin-binding protein 5/6)